MSFYLHNGKFLLGTDGEFATHEDCCCDECPDIDEECVGQDCNYCEDDGRGPTPDTYYVQILTEPTACDCVDVSDRDEGAQSIKITDFNLTGTYKLEQKSGDNCCWLYGGTSATIDIDVWTSSTSCSGTADYSSTQNVSIGLSAKDDGSFQLCAWVPLDGADIVLMSLTWTPDCCADDSHDYVTDDANDYESTDCGNTDSWDQYCLDASQSTGLIAAYDGTLKVVACDSPT